MELGGLAFGLVDGWSGGACFFDHNFRLNIQSRSFGDGCRCGTFGLKAQALEVQELVKIAEEHIVEIGFISSELFDGPAATAAILKHRPAFSAVVAFLPRSISPETGEDIFFGIDRAAESPGRGDNPFGKKDFQRAFRRQLAVKLHAELFIEGGIFARQEQTAGREAEDQGIHCAHLFSVRSFGAGAEEGDPAIGGDLGFGRHKNFSPQRHSREQGAGDRERGAGG